jgi:hypothetical protein
MVDCEICEDIYSGQYKKRKYRIWTILGREGTLMYWYVIMYDDTYEKEYCNPDTQFEKVNDMLTNQAIDIRKLLNYVEMNTINILVDRKNTVIPIIKDAIKSGYINPI